VVPTTEYEGWVRRSRATAGELAAMARQAAGFAYLPRFSLVLAVSDADEVWIKSTLDSCLGQAYPHLEICVCDNGSARPHVPEVLEDYAEADPRVRVRRLPEKGSRAAAYAAGVSMAEGEYVALLGEGDQVAPETLFRAAESLQESPADVVYTDEDRIDVGGRRSDPVFKPYWSPDLLLSEPYVGRLCVIRKSLIEAAGGVREGFEGAEEHDLVLRLSERTDLIRHLPWVLYSRRSLPGEAGPSGDGSSRAVREALARRGEAAEVELRGGSLRVVRRPSGDPKVGVILRVPKGMTDVVLPDGLEQGTSHPIAGVTVAGVDGAARAPFAERVEHPFPARALNLAAEASVGEYLAFMDARTRLTTPGWLSELLAQAQRGGVGLVGCRLENPDGGLRHGGSFAELGRLVGYPDEPEFGGTGGPPLVEGPFNFAVASAECMVVSRAAFEEVGGFDDGNLPTAFYDLDLSLRLRERGRINVYTPHVSVVCDNPGDGAVATLPGEGEIEYMWRRWWPELVRLLYYRFSPLHATRHGRDEQTLALLPSRRG
jgi:GT2 family glycosyltransferase